MSSRRAVAAPIGFLLRAPGGHHRENRWVAVTRRVWIKASNHWCNDPPVMRESLARVGSYEPM
ncbi:MAG: hypothetical protein ACRDO8_07445, partial [Nocardioidaceae bacterium]